MAYTQLSLDTFICVIGITIFVTCQFDVHCSIFKGRISENCPPPLEQIDPSNSSFIYPRPDVMLEGKYSGHEDIYGEKCFWIYLRGVVQHFTVHLSIMRKHNPFCSNLTVNGVELIAYGYIKQNERHLRIPVGMWDRLYQDGTSCFLTGSVNLSPNHIKIPGAPKLHSHPECHKTPGPLNTIESNSYRMVKHHGNDGTPLSLPDSVGVIACAKWLYDPKDLLYPYEMWKAKKLHLDFV
ncbi:unnamed protein product [Orchesella dallaii]|uniref:Uncharacterized protein n=1 Tax=Orchesella dallaii TaxID=48710 RepID=A0ABP1PMB5_9HEXA